MDFAAIMEEVLEAERQFEAHDSAMTSGSRPMGGNPFSPWTVAEKLAVPEAVPFLIKVLAGTYPHAQAALPWALRAVDQLGPAARAASEHVERLGEMLTLWSIDEPRARAFAVHQHAGTWRSRAGITARHCIARRIVDGDPEQARAHFEELLGDPDLEVVKFALDSVRGDSSCLYQLAWETPDGVPVEAVRRHVRGNNTKVAAAAARILMVLHHPEDAGPVIDVCARTELVDTIDVRWLAPHPRSHLLYERLTIRQTFEVVRWRRCANLPAELPEHLRGAERSLHDRDDRSYAPRLDAELAGRLLAPTTIDAADDRFMAMQLVDFDADGGAYGHYARVLLATPGHAHAALQCAWIDRLYGAPITPERVAWLRSLGVRDGALLDELATPVAQPLAGKRATGGRATGTQADAFAHLSRVWDATRT